MSADDNVDLSRQNQKPNDDLDVNQTQQLPGANLSPNSPLPTKEQMALPGDSKYQSPKGNFKAKKSFKFNKKAWIKFLAAIFIVITIALLVWFFIFNKDKKQESQSQGSAKTAEPNQVNNAVNNDALGSSELSKTHTNDFLRLSFSYPDSWQVSDENDVMLVKSPKFSYQSSDGSTKEGFFKIYIKQQAGTSDSKYLGRGYAVSQSEKIAYAEPEAGQRKETYLTSFGLDSADNFAFFIVQGNFDLKTNETLGPKYASEPDAFLIAGGFGSDDLSDPLATNLMDLNNFKDEVAYKTAIEIIKSLKLK